MSDIVERLLDCYENWGIGSKGPIILKDAADEIERLRALSATQEQVPVEVTAEALRTIAGQHLYVEMNDEARMCADFEGGYDSLIAVARAALAASTPPAPVSSEPICEFCGGPTDVFDQHFGCIIDNEEAALPAAQLLPVKEAVGEVKSFTGSLNDLTIIAWAKSPPPIGSKLYLHPAPSSAGVVGEWQNISTAPKDGTWILVFEPTEHSSMCHVVRWGQPQWSGGKKTWVTLALGPNPDTYDADEATHWQPLPAAPQPKQEEGK